jgi:hypothetical protein
MLYRPLLRIALILHIGAKVSTSKPSRGLGHAPSAKLMVDARFVTHADCFCLRCFSGRISRSHFDLAQYAAQLLTA